MALQLLPPPKDKASSTATTVSSLKTVVFFPKNYSPPLNTLLHPYFFLKQQLQCTCVHTHLSPPVQHCSCPSTEGRKKKIRLYITTHTSLHSQHQDHVHLGKRLLENPLTWNYTNKSLYKHTSTLCHNMNGKKKVKTIKEN